MPPAGPQTGSRTADSTHKRRAPSWLPVLLALGVALIARPGGARARVVGADAPAQASTTPAVGADSLDRVGATHTGGADSLARADTTHAVAGRDSLGGQVDSLGLGEEADSLEQEGAMPAHEGALADTLGVKFELGGSTDVTTEQFYEDAFLDSVALGLRQVGSPESRFAAVWHTTAAGTRGGRASAYRVENELSWGDLVREDLLVLDWRRIGPSAWTWGVTPRGEYRRDRTFGRDLEEERVAASARVRRAWAEQASAVELSGQAEWFRAHGTGADFVPDRDVGGLMLRFDWNPQAGPEWELGYGATTRTFPDSTVRDHVEQRGEAAFRSDLTGGHQFDLDAALTRRSTLHAAPTSQDRFLDGELNADAELSFGSDWGASLRARLERLRYDERDTTVFFDYDLAHLELEPRWSNGAWSIRVGPRFEWLVSPGDPSDEYRELGGAIEAEWVHSGWWSITPSAGWREYPTTLESAPAPGAQPVTASRSSFAFVQLDALGDQPLPGRMRVLLYASGRLERHTDPAQDARSLYISLDVRRLF